jgi:hypothetical protein
LCDVGVVDWLCTMTVIDMGYDSPGLRVLYFAPNDMQPHVKAVGDIIRFHRIRVIHSTKESSFTSHLVGICL